LTAKGLLAGYRVVDTSWAAAGPYATEILAFLGAEVIKVETSGHPDLFRRIVDNPAAGLDASTRFNALNLGKLGLRVNLQKPAGLEIFRRLIAKSDAFVENYRPGVVDRLGISYSELIKLKPDLVMISISAAGRGGPHSSHPGYASIFNAMGGLGHLTGYRDGPPTEVRDSVDLRVASVAAFAVVAALLHRKRTGAGQWVDISAREAIASFVGDALIEFALTGVSPVRDGNHAALNAPYDVFRCQGEDSWVAIGVSTDEEWVRLCDAMCRPELAGDSRFADRLSRHEHRDELDVLVGGWTTGLTASDAAARCRTRGVAASEVLGGGDFLSDSHVVARDMIQEVEHPLLGNQLVVRGPWRLGSGDGPPLKPSPMLGEDNEVVLAGLLGYSRDEIKGFRDANVFE
jgi:crotonobetainyl-CoA:carnitine CoA-transferase CaiB-like acyl-CoA transferase